MRSWKEFRPKIEDYPVFVLPLLIENAAEHAVVQTIRLVGSAAVHAGED